MERPAGVRLVAGVFLVASLALAGTASAQDCASIELFHDVQNCGTCGNDCTVGSLNASWACNLGTCEFLGCSAGFYDIDGDESCEYACAFSSSTELCNGVDDDCDGAVDEGVVPPPTSTACGLPLGATSPECTTGVSVTCNAGAWECSFPAGVCTGGCSEDDEVCDALDNDCDGAVNENVSGYGLACASDVGLPPPGHGPCATTGVYVCDGPNAVVCSASKADCATLPGGCTEICDGLDNDCDGSVDESYLAPGTDPAHFVRPAVTRVSLGLWMFTYEASRPDASPTHPGYGNGYHCIGACTPLPSAPLGVVLDETVACSEPGRQPWAVVTPIEVEQACDAVGGFVCSRADYQSACESIASCEWGYSPVGPACNAPFTGSKYCNLSVSYDFDPGASGPQFGLLEVASPNLASCATDWAGTFPGNSQLFDTTGNLREITKVGPNQYALMGGSYLTEVEAGATCSFDFLAVDEDYLHRDTGFRCCFAQDPGL